MSDTATAPIYTVTLTADERDAVLQALAATPHGRNAEAGDAAFYKVKTAQPKAVRKPAAPRSAAEPFAPATGDADLDAFMRAHHSPDWQARQRRAFRRTAPGMISMPTPPKGWPLEGYNPRRHAALFG